MSQHRFNSDHSCARRGLSALLIAVCVLVSVGCVPDFQPPSRGAPLPGATPVVVAPTTGLPASTPNAELGQPATIRLHETATFAAENLTVTFARIVSDSRCPTNVSCFWSGQLAVEMWVARGSHVVEALPVVSIDPVQSRQRPMFEDYHFTMSKVLPARVADLSNSGPGDKMTIRPEDYVVDLLVTRVEGGILAAPDAQLQRLVEIPFGATATFAGEGLNLQFAELAAETRCPKNDFVTCAQAGDASIRLQARHASAIRELTLTLPGLTDDTRELREGAAVGYRVSFDGYRIQLIALFPQPPEDKAAPKWPATAYRATLLVTRES